MIDEEYHELNACELDRLGDDAEIHEQVRQKVIEGMAKTIELGYTDAALDNVTNLLEELIRIRDSHDLPNNGTCYRCDGSKCSGLDPKGEDGEVK